LSFPRFPESRFANKPYTFLPKIVVHLSPYPSDRPRQESTTLVRAPAEIPRTLTSCR
jgi:hypothetical protein